MARRATQLALLGSESAEHTRRAWKGGVSASRARKGPPAVPRPWPCVVLAVDTARVSGWSIWVQGKYAQSGEFDTLNASEIERVVSAGALLAEAGDVPYVLVLEKPWGGNVTVVAALGAARERWLSAWRKLAVGNVGKVVTVAVPTWRARVLGGNTIGMKRDQVRPIEQAAALGLKGARPGVSVGGVGPDEAPAVCIGKWATHAGELAKHMGKRIQRKAMVG